MIALIPFRSGSKRVPDKNIRKFNKNGVELPLFVHTLKQVFNVDGIDMIILATDYSINLLRLLSSRRDIANCTVYKRDGVSDEQPASEYIRDVIKQYNISEQESICLLQPTCSLKSIKDIIQAKEVYYRDKDKYKTLVSVTEVSSLNKVYTKYDDEFESISKDKILACDEKIINTEVATVYMRNSSIYIFNVGYFLEHNSIFEHRPNYYIMPAHRSIDINTEEDFRMAEALSKVCDIE